MTGGWTQTPNYIFDMLPRMKEAEIKVVMLIVRETTGWQREEIELSIGDFIRMTGLARASVINGIRDALKRGILDRKENGNSYIYRIAEPPLTDETVQNLDRCEAEPVQNLDYQTVQNLNYSEDEQPKTVQNLDCFDEKSVQILDGSNFEPVQILDRNATETVQNLDRQVVQNLDHTQININTKKTEEEKRERASPRTHSLPRYGRVTSPHLDIRHLVDGFIPVGKGKSAVEVYYERFSVRKDEERLSAPLEDDLIHNCPDLNLLREVIEAYHQRGYRPRNIRLILDWYKDPNRFRSEQHATAGRNSGTNYERPTVADFSKAQWDVWESSRPGDEIPY